MLSLFVIGVSAIFLAFGYLLGANEAFLLGFATSTMTLGFGMLLVSFIMKIRTGEIPRTKYDERETFIAYKAGFTTYIISLFSLAIFIFVLSSARFALDISSRDLALAILIGMSVCFFSSMLIFRFRS